MRNNIIAIVAISFTIMGILWGLGHLLSQNKESLVSDKGGVILIAKDDLFNETNPDIHVKAGVPLRVTLINKDFRKHDFVVNGLNINTGFLSSEQEFTTAIASLSNGTYQYYCSLHPEKMHGNVIIVK